MSDLKPWRSFPEQLNILKSRGLQADDESAALRYLERIGYYRLSGYWYGLRQIDRAESQAQNRAVRLDEFMQGSRFKDIVNLYVFDKKLRLLALDALERIEMALRVDIAYLLGKKDPLAYANPNCLHGNFTKQPIKSGPNKGKVGHELWLEKHESMLRRAKKEPFVQHHKRKYREELPIWVAIELWDFGMLSHLFDGMKYADKNQIAQKYKLDTGDELARWLRSLNFIRNVSAHHSRLWNINVLEYSNLPNGWPEMNPARPFMYFAMMAHLLSAICPNSTWTARLVELLHDFPLKESNLLTLEDFGVCDDWEKWMLQGEK